MHISNSKLTKIIALFLTFLLGFVTCAGAIVGIGYYAYSRVSYNKLLELGYVSGDPSEYVDPNASVPITDVTLQMLLGEISSLSSSENEMTIDEFFGKYGLKLSEELKNSLPEGVFKVSFRTLFTADGINEVLSKTGADYILDFIPESTLGDTLKKQLEGKTLEDVLDFEALLSDIQLGELMGYTPIYKNGEVVRWETTDGKEVEPTLKNVVSLTVGELTDGGFSTDSLFDGLYVGDALGYTPHYGPDGEVDYWTETVDAKDGDGNPIDADGDGVTDKVEARVTGIDNGIANVNLGLILDDSSSYNIEDAFSGICFGELMGYSKKTDADGYFVDPDGNRLYRVDDEGNYFSVDGSMISREDIELVEKADYAWLTKSGSDVGAIANKLANYVVSDILEGNIKFNSSDMTDGIAIADIMDFVAKEYMLVETATDEKYELVLVNEGDIVPAGTTVIKRWFDSDGEEISGVLAAIADKEIDEMSSAISDLLIADVLGYYDIGEVEGLVGEETTVWYDVTEIETVPGEISYFLERASGLMLNFAGLSIDDMSNNSKVSGAIKSVVVGEALGYKEIDGVWYTDSGEEVSGIMSNIVGLKVSDIDARVTVMTVADVLGYERVDGVWMDGTSAVTGIMERLASARLNELNAEVHSLYFGDIEGYTLCKEETDGSSIYFIPLTDDERENIQNGVVDIELYTWCSHNGDGTYTKAEGITVKFANLKIDDMTNGDLLVEQLQTVTLSEAFPNDYQSGFLSLIDPYTSLQELAGDGERSLSNTFKNVFIQEYVDAGLLDFGVVDSTDDITTVSESLNALDFARLMANPNPIVKFDSQNGFYYCDNDSDGVYNPDLGDTLYGWRVQTISSLISYILNN